MFKRTQIHQKMKTWMSMKTQIYPIQSVIGFQENYARELRIWKNVETKDVSPRAEYTNSNRVNVFMKIVKFARLLF